MKITHIMNIQIQKKEFFFFSNELLKNYFSVLPLTLFLAEQIKLSNLIVLGNLSSKPNEANLNGTSVGYIENLQMNKLSGLTTILRMVLFIRAFFLKTSSSV